jgi:hypothetical protein
MRLLQAGSISCTWVGTRLLAGMPLRREGWGPAALMVQGLS